MTPEEALMTLISRSVSERFLSERNAETISSRVVLKFDAVAMVNRGVFADCAEFENSKGSKRQHVKMPKRPAIFIEAQIAEAQLVEQARLTP
jgi:hypothetical protein